MEKKSILREFFFAQFVETERWHGTAFMMKFLADFGKLQTTFLSASFTAEYCSGSFEFKSIVRTIQLKPIHASFIRFAYCWHVTFPSIDQKAFVCWHLQMVVVLYF